MTPPVVEQSRVVLAIATGEGKRDAVRRLLHGDDDAKQTPAHLLRRAKDLRLMIDRAAYEK
jgi:6-phosphogluconolactonase/glucosamine-6-phosphate isomerase/deaminase